MNTVINIKDKMYINCGEVTIKYNTFLVLRNVENDKYGFLKKVRDETGSMKFDIPTKEEIFELKTIFNNAFDGEMYAGTNFSSISEEDMKKNGYMSGYTEEFKECVEIVRNYMNQGGMSTELLDRNLNDLTFEVITKMWEAGSEAEKRKARISYNIYTNKITIYPEGYLYVLDDSKLTPEEKLVNAIFINEKIEAREKMDIIHELFHISIREAINVQGG